MDFFVEMVGFFSRLPRLPAFIDRLLGFSAIFTIRLYQVFVSSWRKRDCFFTPTCSHWTIRLIKNSGFKVGLSQSYAHMCNCGSSHSLRLGLDGKITLIGSNGEIYKQENLSKFLVSKIKQ